MRDNPARGRSLSDVGWEWKGALRNRRNQPALKFCAREFEQEYLRSCRRGLGLFAEVPLTCARTNFIQPSLPTFVFMASITPAGASRRTRETLASRHRTSLAPRIFRSQVSLLAPAVRVKRASSGAWKPAPQRRALQPECAQFQLLSPEVSDQAQ